MEFRIYRNTLLVYAISLCFIGCLASDNSLLSNELPLPDIDFTSQSSSEIEANINAEVLAIVEGEKKGVKAKRGATTSPAKHKILILTSIAAAVIIAATGGYYYFSEGTRLIALGKQLKQANHELKKEVIVIRKMFDAKFREAEFDRLSALDKEEHSGLMYRNIMINPVDVLISDDQDKKMVSDFRVSVWTNSMLVYLQHVDRYLVAQAGVTFKILADFVGSFVPELTEAIDAFDIKEGLPLELDFSVLKEKIQAMEGVESCCKIKKLRYFLENGANFLNKIYAAHTLGKQMMEMCSKDYTLACQKNVDILKHLKQ